MSMPTATCRIDDRDRVAPPPPMPAARRERVWRLPLGVAHGRQRDRADGPRAVVFRLGASGRTLGYAAAGYLEGAVSLGDKGERIHRVPYPPPGRAASDGDGNGLLADTQDRLWIDLNGDGRFDPAAEQFLFATVLNLDGARYVVRSDELGSRLAIEPLMGTGTLRLAWQGDPAASAGGKVRRDARHGDRPRRLGLRDSRAPSRRPSGRRIPAGNLTVSLDDAKRGQPGRSSSPITVPGSRGPAGTRSRRTPPSRSTPSGSRASRSAAVTMPTQPAKPGDGRQSATRPLHRRRAADHRRLLRNAGLARDPGTPGCPGRTCRTTDGQTLATAHSGFS